MTYATDLRAVQTFLEGAFRAPDALSSDAARSADCVRHVAGNTRVTPVEQADIYRRQYWMRHRDSLEEDHPGALAVLGDDGFERLLRDYLAVHPPSSFTLRDLGAHLHRFAETWPGVEGPLRDLLLDTLDYELVLIDLFDAADPPAPNAALLSVLTEDDWTTARLVLTPLLRLRTYRYPIPQLRRGVKEGKDIYQALGVEDTRALANDGGEAPPYPGALRALPEAKPSHWAIFRRELQNAYEELTPEACDLVRSLSAGTPLVPACEALARGLSEERAAWVESQLGSWFQAWAAWGWIVDVDRVSKEAT